ncbi:DUF4381 domain-containing protein [Thiohalocapsa sp. ML1]|jgi:hypothetical protein|uniref:DUF4381 domain-containing protein n=1 Tax=Thiohalocapsa sp. ML1 TaxID=1431688 RepID=UPI000A541880|nr:DUF4381 domain-containing protein [Thiohalocapsa sp. ML1]
MSTPAMTSPPPGHAAVAPAPPPSQELKLRDIHVPGAPPAWPPAPGWWLVVLLLLGALGYGLWRLRKRWLARRRRERIIAQLDGLAGERCGPALVGAVSALLKRAALSRYARTDVAPLTGAAWLAFLDRTGGAGGFRNGPGQVLADGAYAPTRDCDAEALLALARRWLRQNL